MVTSSPPSPKSIPLPKQPRHAKLATLEEALSMGLNENEFQQAKLLLGRVPNGVELGIISVMWSEHCSYKSSRRWLKTLPTRGPRVIQGPGENAGVVNIGDGLAAVFKIESHNHPSFIEPYQGAATGVGGILRDVFTMGARPIANLNALRFGDPAHARTPHLLSGVVAGIGGYGNSIGVPTIGGETEFDAGYNGNILVNAMTVGIAKANQIFYAKASGVGNPVIYAGAKTGRDGIHGATMASAEFSEGSESQRPTVQVGDPFVEKLLLEACLELMAEDAIVAIQDMGAAGLTSSSVEMANRGGLGIRLVLDRVPMRETHMEPYELMLSESQERMLMVLKPGSEAKAAAIFAKWQLDCVTIGHLTDSGLLELEWFGEIVASLPLAPLVEEAPLYDRPWLLQPPPPPFVVEDKETAKSSAAILEDLGVLMGGPHLSSRRWIYRQYDHLIGGQTLVRPGGGGASVIGIENYDKALAVTVDCTPRYCLADPLMGGRQAVAEAWRNLIAAGSLPIALTNNLNFGNPERLEIMGQLVAALQGMSEASLALDFPVISGNVSLYNETDGKAIPPTPVIGGVGLIEGRSNLRGIAASLGDEIYLVGAWGSPEGLGQSRYAHDIWHRKDGSPPPLDLAIEKRHGLFVKKAISQKFIGACQDLSDGGLMIALAEMALASQIGVVIDVKLSSENHGLADQIGFWYGEDQSRYLVAVTADKRNSLVELANEHNIRLTKIGVMQGLEIVMPQNIAKMPLDALRKLYESYLPDLMQ